MGKVPEKIIRTYHEEIRVETHYFDGEEVDVVHLPNGKIVVGEKVTKKQLKAKIKEYINYKRAQHTK